MCYGSSSLIDTAPIRTNATAAHSKSFINNCHYYLGKKVDWFRYDVLPDVAKAISDLSRTVLKNCFFAVPIVALGLGSYSDAAVSTVISGISLIDWRIKNRNFREASCLTIGIPLAISFTVKAIKVVTACSSVNVISLAIQSLCLLKLALIGKGRNY